MSVTTTRKVGDLVSVNDPSFPGIWKIRSLGPVNAVLDPVAGGRGLRFPKDGLLDPTTEPLAPEPFVYFAPGDIVEIADGSKYAGLYAVLADKGEKVNVALLGGDGGRYVRASRRSLKKLSLADLAEKLSKGGK
jgi:hypothetical protein